MLLIDFQQKILFKNQFNNTNKNYNKINYFIFNKITKKKLHLIIKLLIKIDLELKVKKIFSIFTNFIHH